MSSAEDIPKVETGDSTAQGGGGLQEELPTVKEWHVIVRGGSEDDRRHGQATLVRLGLQPYEEWSTEHATSYRISATNSRSARQQLGETDLSWTLVPPGASDYLLHSVMVTGPDGRQFRLTDSPAQQTVSDLAAEVVSEYTDIASADRPVIVEHIPGGGQGRRLDPDETLEESGVQDGDRLRVSFQARAGGGPFFYYVFITFEAGTLDFRQFSFVITALDELYATLASAMAIKFDSNPSSVQSPQLISVVMQSPLTIGLGATVAGGGASIAALRVLAAVLRDPSLLGGFIPKVKTGWYDARATQYEAQIRLEAVRRLAGDVSVQVSSVNSPENEELELRSLLVDGRDIEPP